MNSLQLYTLAQRCPHLKEVFIGVFPSDCIPNFRLLKTRRRAFALIVNLDKNGDPGSHWIALYLPKRCDGVAEYFDSYGHPPTLPSLLATLGNYKSYIYNDVTLQSPFSTVCGQYCLFYLCHRARRVNPSNILKKFHNLNVATNDILVNKYIKRYFRTNLRLCDISFIGRQIAASLQPYENI